MRVDWRVVDTLALVYCGHRHSLIYSTATRTIQLGSNARCVGPCRLYFTCVSTTLP